MTQKIQKEKFRSELDEKGHEIPDPKPKILRVGLGRPLTLQEQIARVLTTKKFIDESESQVETFEESQDFDTGEDSLITSPYEITEMEEEILPAPDPSTGGIIDGSEVGENETVPTETDEPKIPENPPES